MKNRKLKIKKWVNKDDKLSNELEILFNKMFKKYTDEQMRQIIFILYGKFIYFISKYSDIFVFKYSTSDKFFINESDIIKWTIRDRNIEAIENKYDEDISLNINYKEWDQKIKVRYIELLNYILEKECIYNNLKRNMEIHQATIGFKESDNPLYIGRQIKEYFKSILI